MKTEITGTFADRLKPCCDHSDIVVAEDHLDGTMFPMRIITCNSCGCSKSYGGYDFDRLIHLWNGGVSHET